MKENRYFDSAEEDQTEEIIRNFKKGVKEDIDAWEKQERLHALVTNIVMGIMILTAVFVLF